MLTLLQLLLLAWPCFPLGLVLFRLQLYWLTGPLLALLFPVTWTREMPGQEKLTHIRIISNSEKKNILYLCTHFLVTVLLENV